MMYNPDISPHAIIHPECVIEPGVKIGPFCIIGYPAENIATYPGEGGKVIIRSGVILTGMVTIDSGVEGNTEIGPDCFIMKHCHIGHDTVLGSQVRMAPGSIVGGHCVVNKRVYIGMNATIKNRVNVPELCMIGMGAVVVDPDLKKSSVYVGNPAKYKSGNKKGMAYWYDHDNGTAMVDYLEQCKEDWLAAQAKYGSKKLLDSDNKMISNYKGSKHNGKL